jgi:hypothetical protein
MTELIFLPTPDSCEAIGFKRFPAKYGSDASSNSTREAAETIGVQYKKFGDSPLAKSLQKLDVPSQFNPRDIVIEVLSNNPYTIKTVRDSNGVIRSVYNYGDNKESQYKIHISPSSSDEGFELEINHKHNWEASGSIFDKLLKGASELIGNVDDFVTKFGNTIKGIKGQSNTAAYKATPNRRIDVAETYMSSDKQSILIPFTLFTPGGEKNFLRDIYAPIMTLTKISYPKRATSLGDVDKWASSIIGVKKDSKGSSTNGTDTQGVPRTEAEDANALDLVNAINPGFRVFVSDPPPYVNVYHNGGLFKYNNCYISNFKYTYKQWVDGDGDPIRNGGDRTTGNFTITETTVKNARFSYPLIAKCELEIKTTEPLFADDFVALASEYGQNRSTAPR